MAWDSQNIADLLSQQVPPPQAQPMPVPVSLNQAPIPAPVPRQITPVSIQQPVDPGRTGIAVEGNVYGDTFAPPQQRPLTAFQAAALRRKAAAMVAQ